MKKDLDFSGCKTAKDIEDAVLKCLRYCEVVDGFDGAKEYFQDCGIYGDVCEHLEYSKEVSIYDEEANGEHIIKAMIYSYYVDAGSNDYVYSYIVF